MINLIDDMHRIYLAYYFFTIEAFDFKNLVRTSYCKYINWANTIANLDIDEKDVVDFIKKTAKDYNISVEDATKLLSKQGQAIKQVFYALDKTYSIERLRKLDTEYEHTNKGNILQAINLSNLNDLLQKETHDNKEQEPELFGDLDAKDKR